MKRALITGITGQDGSYLAELLLDKGYEVHGIVRRVAIEDPEHRLWRILHVKDRLHLHAASLESLPSVYRVFHAVKPDECYHLAAQSFVAYSFEDEFSTLNANINGTHHVLTALRDCTPGCRFYFAASSEMFGKVAEVPQNERTPFHPRSAYGISKVAGFHLTRNYREAYGIKASSGILYNHESPRRGFEFVTRKITSHAARIKLGLAKEVRLGNLDARRDWGHARDYVQAMWLMLQQERPRRLCGGDGRATYGSRVRRCGIFSRRPQLSRPCRRGPPVPTTRRSRNPIGRCDNGQKQAGVVLSRQISGSRQGNGGGGSPDALSEAQGYVAAPDRRQNRSPGCLYRSPSVKIAQARRPDALCPTPDPQERLAPIVCPSIRALKRVRLLATDVDGVLTDAGMYYSESGDELKKFNTHDGMGIKLLQRAGFLTALITQEETKLVARRGEKLAIPEIHQRAGDKLAVMRGIIARHGLSLREVAYIGDDVNDLETLKAVGFSAAPADSLPQVLEAVHYVCRKKGGEGAVREVVDLILTARGISAQSLLVHA